MTSFVRSMGRFPFVLICPMLAGSKVGAEDSAAILAAHWPFAKDARAVVGTAQRRTRSCEPARASREEESFLVLEGEMTFQLGEDRIVAGEGTFLSMPIGSLHCFKNESSKTARLLISVASAGLEPMFFEVGQPLTDEAETAPPPSRADIEKLLEAAPRFGVEIKVPHE